MRIIPLGHHLQQQPHVYNNGQTYYIDQQQHHYNTCSTPIPNNQQHSPYDLEDTAHLLLNCQPVVPIVSAASDNNTFLNNNHIDPMEFAQSSTQPPPPPQLILPDQTASFEDSSSGEFPVDCLIETSSD